MRPFDAVRWLPGPWLAALTVGIGLLVAAIVFCGRDW